MLYQVPTCPPVHPPCPPCRTGAAATPPPHPPVMLGVILAHTGMVALALIQPHTSYRISQS